MARQVGSDNYQKGLECAAVGQYEQGWECLCEHLRTAPQDVQALNDAGVVLYHLGRTDEAIGLLTEARRLRADDPEITGNLLEAYLGGGRAAEATQLFDDMEHAGLWSIDVANRTATMLLDQGDKSQAIEVLLRSQRLWPQQEQLPPILDALCGQRPRVAFFHNHAGDGRRLPDLCEFVQQRFPTESYAGDDPETIAGLMDWSDIAWFDRGGEILVEASRYNSTPKMVISIRRSDLCDRWVKEVRWERVDILALIGSSVEDLLQTHVPEIHHRTRLVMIPYGINANRYPLRRRERGKHLACLGPLTLEANPAFLLQCLQKLHYLDAGCRLFFSGGFENSTLERYVRHMIRKLDLSDVVFFDPYPRDLNGWLSDKHFLVAAGMTEGRLEAVLAGMACGVKPVIHHFSGADTLLPPSCLFNIAEQFCEQVFSRDYQPGQYRRFVEEHYPLEPQLKQINGILVQLEAELEQQARKSPRPMANVTKDDPGVSIVQGQ